MAAHAGKDVLLTLSDGADPPVFTPVAGVRAKSLSLNAGVIDATHAESPGRWRELIAGAGVRSASLTGSGVFVDAATDAQTRRLFFDQERRDWRLVIADFGALAGPFLVTRLEYAGRHDGEATYSLTLASAGELTFEEI